MSESDQEDPRAAWRASEEGAGADGGGLWLILALALGLARFWRLGHWSLWYDEALTLADATHAELSYNAPGYALIRLTVLAFGGLADEFSLRFLPALAGWLAIPLTYWAFRPVAGGKRAALAALLVAISSWEIYWSQNARAYTLAQAAGLVGGGLVLRGLVRGRVHSVLLGTLVTAAGIGFHLQSAVLLLALIVAPIGAALVGHRPGPEARRALKVLIGTGLVAILVGSPWVVGALRDYLAKKQEFGVVSQLAHFVKSTGFFVTPLLGVAAVCGIVQAFGSRSYGGVLCTWVVVIGLAAVATVGLFAQVTAQYAFVLMPWIALLAAWPVATLARGGRLASLGFAALVVLPTAAETGLYFTVRMGERSRWREAYGYVWNQHHPGDVILGMQAGLADFYLDPGSTNLREPRTAGWADRYSVDNYALWARRGRPMWLVVRPDFFGKWTGRFAPERAAFRAFLKEDCRLMMRFPVTMEGRDLDLEVYYRE
ncbi:MAG: hypothetical protein GY711_01380 [bacterium]|nr:hypothetical protein [bacterium]